MSASNADAGELPPGHVIGPDGTLHPGRLLDLNIHAVLLARVHEIRHETGFGCQRIRRQLAARTLLHWLIALSAFPGDGVDFLLRQDPHRVLVQDACWHTPFPVALAFLDQFVLAYIEVIRQI
jgi:hypothetical protein